MPEKLWYDGLTHAEIAIALADGSAPGARTPGAWIRVPDGFLRLSGILRPLHDQSPGAADPRGVPPGGYPAPPMNPPPAEETLMPTNFRPLNANEKAAILAAAKKGRLRADDPRVEFLDDLVVSYESQQGGFQVALLTFVPGSGRIGVGPLLGTLYRGASRRSYKDPRNRVKGEMLAFSRAILFSRPTPLP